ncbi:MAG: APC family permease [Planctomycetaceae bacterium]
MEPQSLRRQVGVFGATMMGLGSILGTGIFVSVGIAAGLAGPSVIFAIVLAAMVASCNALNSAQLAASLPVSGGTYEYGYHYLRPWLGFLAGWMFLCAKIASAATAAIGFAGYLSVTLGIVDRELQHVIAAATVATLTLVVVQGIRPSSMINIVLVCVTLLALGLFIAAGLPLVMKSNAQLLTSMPSFETASFFEATALMFVAYTGYGRIATLGEEVHAPRTTIPRAIILTLIISAVVYVAVAVTGIGAVGADAMYEATQTRSAPLTTVAEQFGYPGLAIVVAAGAMSATLGVLLNLLLGLSRVLLAMGRRGDMPRAVARLNQSGTTPYVAVLVIGATIGTAAWLGSIKTTWSFSAFTVLLYYAVTNLAALAIPREHRLYPRWLAWCGLIACLFLAFWVEWQVWASGLGIALAGLLWHAMRRTTASRLD